MKNDYDSDNINGRNSDGFSYEPNFDINSFNEEQLQMLLDFETDRLFEGTANTALMEAYSKRLAELRGDALKTEKTTETIITELEEETVNKRETKTRKRIPKTKLIAVAAVIGAMACLTTATVAGPTTQSMARAYVVSNPVGTTVELDSAQADGYACTVTHSAPTASYASMDELLAALECEVYYPTLFPEGKTPIRFSTGSIQGYNEFSVALANADISFNAILNYSFTEDEVAAEHFDVYEAHGKKFYLDREYKNSAFFFDGGNYYTINAIGTDRRDDLILIIDNLKKG